MCYCYRKLDFMTKCGRPCACEAEFGRPWEAVGGRGALIGSDRSGTLWHIYLSQSGPHGLRRPPKFGLTRPYTASHRLGLPQFVMWSVWANQSLSHTRPHRLWAMQSDPRAVWLISRLNALLRPVESNRTLTASQIGLTDRPHRSDSQICEAVGGRGRPSTASHFGLSDRSHDFVVRGRARRDALLCPVESNQTLMASQIGLTDQTLKSVRPKWEAVWEADRPLTHTGRCSPILGAVWLISRLNALHCPVCVRGRSASHMASHFGLTDRPHRSDSHGLPHGLTDHRSDSLTDLTMWQIWQIHLIAI